jgi:electron transfer flavoprotein alpha subunit
VANILCYMEHTSGEATPASLETLGQARRLGTQLGATVFASVALDKAPGYGDDDLLAQVAAGGADKVILVVGDGLHQDPAAVTWESHGPALAAAWDVCQPTLTLLPATGAGRELGPRAAARVGAAFLHECFAEVRDGTLILAEGQGEAARLISGELEFPVVVTVPPGRYAAAAGDEEAEVEVLQIGAASRFVEDPAVRSTLPLRARVELPSALSDLPLPPPLASAERVAGAAGTTSLLVELTTAKGPLRIALGTGAGDLERADFAAEGPPDQLLTRLFTPGQADPAERRR